MTTEVKIQIDANLIQEQTEIGVGGFGKIYLGVMDGMDVAIKKLKVVSSDEKSKNAKNSIGPSDKGLLMKELKSMIKLWNRGGIVRTLGYFYDTEKNISLVMEYVNGGNLKNYIKQNGDVIGWEGKRILLSKILHALHICHNENLIHSDIKAENIVMDHNLNPKICDFGASILDNEIDTANYGSLRWVSQERINDDSKPTSLYKATKMSDMYSFGLLAWEVLTNGKPPFYWVKNSSGLLEVILDSDKKPTNYTNNYPNIFDIFINDCIKFEPKERIEAAVALKKLDSFDFSREQLNKIFDKLGDNSDNIDGIRDEIKNMSIIMARSNNVSAKQILCMIECIIGNYENARHWVGDVVKQKYKSLFEVAIRNNLKDIASLLYKKNIKLSLQEICFVLSENFITLTTINLSHRDIKNEEAIAIAEALRTNNTLTRIDLSSNKISYEGAIPIAEALRTNKESKITNINLSFNRIKTRGVTAIAKTLEKNNILTSIDLSSNEIKGGGAIAIAEALITNEESKVTNINLNSNIIKNRGAIAIAEALKMNNILTIINLSSNEISCEGAIQIAEALRTNNTLTSIDLSSNKIMFYNKYITTTDDGVKAIAKALRTNKESKVTNINLSSNEITKGGAIAIAEALKINKKLTNINLENNKISNEGVKEIEGILKTNNISTNIINLQRNSYAGKEKTKRNRKF